MAQRLTKQPHSNALRLLLALFLVLQLSDLILTTVGVNRFGTAAEGNPLLQLLMEHLGVVVSLVVAKTVALVAGYSMFKLAGELLLARCALVVFTCLLARYAVIPWTLILA